MLRIACYNISQGGLDRLDQLIEVIRGINPDILGILEAVTWESDKTEITKFRDTLGYPFFEIAKAPKHNIAIFSKTPITVTAINENVRHVILQAVIHNEFFEGALFFVHLSPVSEDARLIEIGEILERAKKFPQSIIMGDLNSLSSHDPYNTENLIKTFRDKNITKYGEGVLRFDVITKLENHGYTDVMTFTDQPFISTAPTPYNTDPYHAAKLRIDYAFISSNIKNKVKKAEVIKNKKTDYASDHYPLYFELK